MCLNTGALRPFLHRFPLRPGGPPFFKQALFPAPVFAPGRDAAADVPLRFVLIQNLLDLEVKTPVVERKTLLYIFMYGYR